MGSYYITLLKKKEQSMKSKPSPGIRPDTCQIINLKANCSKKKNGGHVTVGFLEGIR